MADSDAHIGFGAQLQKGDGNSPENFVSILGVKSITGPQISRNTVDVTSNSSPSVFREFIGGLIDAGEVSFDANFLPRDATQGQDVGGFMAEFDKDVCSTRGDWRILLPACEGEPEVYFGFEGIVTGQQVQLPMDDVMGFSGTIKVSGRPTLVIDGS